MTKIQEAIERYLADMKLNACSPVTLQAYRRVLDGFTSTLGLLDTGEITRESLKTYRDGVAASELLPRSKNLKLIPVRGLIRFLNNEGVLDVSYHFLDTFRVKNGKKPLDLVAQGELHKYLSHKDNIRNDFLVNLLYDTGLRVAELCALNIEGMKPEFEIVGKGGRERMVLVSPAVLRMFHDYLKERGATSGALFLGYEGERIIPRTVQRIVKDRSDTLGMSQKITPHTLRHFYATRLYEQGIDLDTLREMLGHSSLSTTQIYVRVSRDKMRQAHERTFGDKKADAKI